MDHRSSALALVGLGLNFRCKWGTVALMSRFDSVLLRHLAVRVFHHGKVAILCALVERGLSEAVPEC
jgi:hypothetical protein